MLNWFDMPGALDGFENNPEYLEKLAADGDESAIKQVIPARNKCTNNAVCSWVKKRAYKKKMVRQFLSINPDMDYSKLEGTNAGSAIYLCVPSEDYDPKMSYNFNPYTRVFLSPRGDLRKYHGEAFPIRMSYALGAKDQKRARITNKRIRQHALDEETCSQYSYYKKLYGPFIDEIW